MFDIGNIILWKSNKNLVEIIETSFKDKILLKKIINSNDINRVSAINDLYYPIVPEKNDERYFQNEDIVFYLVELKNHHKMMWRTEGYRMCNTEILGFKNKHRINYSHLEFHCSDNIVECNNAIGVFNIDYKTNLEIIDVDNLYHFIHGNSSNNTECYLKKDFNLVHISNCPVVEYLKGNKQHYLNQSNLFNVRESSITYHMNNYDSDETFEIKVVKIDNKYVVCDGMHRSSILYFNGNRKILVKIVDNIVEPSSAAFLPYINSENIPLTTKKSHWNSLYKLIFELQNQKIKWIVIRGFRKMPYKPDTDLDIIIHPSDYQKFSKLMESFVSNGLFFINHKDTKFQNKTNNLLYSAYSTIGEDGFNLPNNCFQLDIYNDLFFFKNNNGVQFNKKFIDELFKYTFTKSNIIIPHIHFELIILLARVFIDKNGYWSDKHKSILNDIKNSKDFNLELFKKLFLFSMIDSDFSLDLKSINL